VKRDYLDWFDTAPDGELAKVDRVTGILLDFALEIANGGAQKRLGDWALELIDAVEGT
jgi:hypothetical protein